MNSWGAAIVNNFDVLFSSSLGCERVVFISIILLLFALAHLRGCLGCCRSVDRAKAVRQSHQRRLGESRRSTGMT